MCQNDHSGHEVDTGCSDSHPLCNGSEGASFGTQCHRCLNQGAWLQNVEVDEGCSQSAKFCNAGPNAYGSECTRSPMDPLPAEYSPNQGCGLYPSVQTDVVISGDCAGHLFGDLCYIHCPGGSVVLAVTSVCQISGQWSEVFCITPTGAEGGSLDNVGNVQEPALVLCHNMVKDEIEDGLDCGAACLASCTDSDAQITLASGVDADPEEIRALLSNHTALPPGYLAVQVTENVDNTTTVSLRASDIASAMAEVFPYQAAKTIREYFANFVGNQTLVTTVPVPVPVPVGWSDPIPTKFPDALDNTGHIDDSVKSSIVIAVIFGMCCCLGLFLAIVILLIKSKSRKITCAFDDGFGGDHSMDHLLNADQEELVEADEQEASLYFHCFCMYQN